MLPNFLIIGAPRSGTSTLYAALRQHPEIYFSDYKEPWFFSLIDQKLSYTGPGDNVQKRINNIEEYEELFSGVVNEKAVGEASTLYLQCTRAPITIKRFVPDIKLIIILRNPVERAFSNYKQHRQLNREPLNNFKEALEEEIIRKKNGWSPFWFYSGIGFYGKQLENYLHYLNKNQIKVYLYDDLVNNKEKLYNSVFRFLDVDASFKPVISGHFNSSGKPKNLMLHHFLNKPNVIKSVVRNVLPPKYRHLISGWLANVRHSNLHANESIDNGLRRKLIVYYKDDVIKLQSIIERDLSSWIK